MTRRPGAPLPTPLDRPPAVHLARDNAEQVVAARLRRGDWTRVSRGAYVATSPPRGQRELALARIVAVHERLRAVHWFSHESAALVWGLPTWRTPGVTHVRQAARPGAGRDRSIVRHGGAFADGHVTVVGGLPVTDLELTMVDCARTLNPLAALVVADAALRAGADRAVALSLLDEAAGNGTARAVAVIELADGGAESPGETATRFVVLRAGLPRPQTQLRVETRLGTFWGDLGWDEWSLLLEYDGRAKYLSVDDLVREKRRHDALVEAGWQILRVTKEDIPAAAGLAARVRRLLPAGVPVVRRPLLGR